MDCIKLTNSTEYSVYKNQFLHDYNIEIEYIKEDAKSVNINGVQFEIINKHFTHDDIAQYMYNKCMTISDCYKSCSKTKRNIYSVWNDFFNHLKHSCHFTIEGYNCNFFTLSALLYDISDCNNGMYDYMFKITSTKNIMYRIIY